MKGGYNRQRGSNRPKTKNILQMEEGEKYTFRDGLQKKREREKKRTRRARRKEKEKNKRFKARARRETMKKLREAREARQRNIRPRIQQKRANTQYNRNDETGTYINIDNKPNPNPINNLLQNFRTSFKPLENVKVEMTTPQRLPISRALSMRTGSRRFVNSKTLKRANTI